MKQELYYIRDWFTYTESNRTGDHLGCQLSRPNLKHNKKE